MEEAMEQSGSDRPLTRLFERFDLDRLAQGFWPFGGEDRMRIEQQVTDDALVVRAELPGIDPDKDLEITVTDGYLHVRAERRSQHKEEMEGRTQSEFRYGALSRTRRLPPGVRADDIAASYRDGILEVRVPTPADAKSRARRVLVNKR
jgi:HSP20 family protein